MLYWCVFPKKLPVSVAAVCCSVPSSVTLTAVLFPDRTQGFGLLSTLAGANCSLGSEENQDTEVNSNSYFLFFARSVSHVALPCVTVGVVLGGSFILFSSLKSYCTSCQNGFSGKSLMAENSFTIVLESRPESCPRSCHLTAGGSLSSRTSPHVDGMPGAVVSPSNPRTVSCAENITCEFC